MRTARARLALWAFSAALAASAAVSVLMAETPRVTRISVDTADSVRAGSGMGAGPVGSFSLRRD